MGGVWCKTDRGSRPYSPKGPWNSAISRWTDHVRNVYRKPKTYRRPPRPPQKPMRSNEQLTISPPRLMADQSSDGWRTATLKVPEAAPVPPPRKKRKRHAYSMDDLSTSRPELTLMVSTLSLPDQAASHQETGLESRSASTTMVVTPVIERLGVQEEVDTVKVENKENFKIIEQDETDDDDIDSGDSADIIIPIEKETLFSSRTLLHSNLGYIDKLSAISEVSAESGFDDRVDFCKNSERSESAASSVETGVVEPGHDRTTARQVAELNELNREIREKTAISKTAWLQSILKEDAEPYSIPRERRGSAGSADGGQHDDISPPGQPNSLPSRLHLANREADSSTVATSPPTPPPSPTNHSVLLELLKKHSDGPESHFMPREESIFLTNTRTNIIYKSLSKDKLTDDYESDFAIDKESSKDVLKSGPISESDGAPNPTNRVNGSSLTTPLTDYAFQSPQLVESDAGLNSLLSDARSNVVSSFDHKPIKSQHYVSALTNLKVSPVPVVVLNGILPDLPETTKEDANDSVADSDKVLGGKESAPSSRKSSITDSLHEFEMSIYDMLKESKKDSSDEEESLKTVKAEANKH